VRVTIAYDGSEGATRAVTTVATLFPGAEAALVLVPAIPPPTPEMVLTAVPTLSTDSLGRVIDQIAAEQDAGARSVVEAGAEAATAAGLTATAVVAPPRSPAWQGLLEAASGSDVLVCGSRGRSGLRALLGSTSTRLLHHAELPLLVVPECEPASGPVVLAYDGSEAAGAAIRAAGRLLGGRDAVVVHVWESPYRHSLTGRALYGVPVGEVREVVAGLEETIAAAAGEVTEAGVELAGFAGLNAGGETVDSGEGVWRTVAAIATDADACVIVTGARGLGGARSALLGSVSSGLVHNAELPVLVVPPGWT
jgi:nucleotide-binding universal stress UspA family protein